MRSNDPIHSYFCVYVQLPLGDVENCVGIGSYQFEYRENKDKISIMIS